MKQPDSPEDPDRLPDNIPECHSLITGLRDEVKELKTRMSELEKQLRRRNRMIFGQRSAKVSNTVLTGTGSIIYEESVRQLEAEKQNLQLVPDEKKHGGGGRTAPQNAQTEQTVEYTISDPAELACPCCGTQRKVIGFRVSHQLDVLKAIFQMLKLVEYSYACPKCQSEVITASKPYQPIDKGYAGPGLLAYISTSKFVWHSPLYRQEQIYLAQSVPIARSTMCRWLKETAALFKLIVDRMHHLALLSRVMQSDSSSMPVIKKGLGKTHKGYVWLYRGDDNFPYIIYDFTENENSEHPSRMLNGYKNVLQTDGSNRYNDVIKEGATPAACFAHAYRYFEDARTSDPELADQAIAMIKGLYDIERAAVDFNELERKELRKKLAKPMLAALKTWLDQQAATMLPKSAMADAVGYCLNRWDAFCLYADTGFVNIDNNLSENGLRPVVLGRKNWLFAGSVEGGRTAAIHMSIVQTCRRLQIDPFEYMKDALTRLPSAPLSTIDEFLPDRWKARRAQTDTGGS